MDNPDLPNKSVIYELMQVIRQASDSIAVEQQIDEGFEVADSVRFEQSAIDWQSRIPDQTIPVKIRTINRWLDLIEGNVIHHSSDAMILKNTFHTYLVLTESVTAVQNLLTKIRTFDPAVVDDFLLTIWLHGIVDSKFWLPGFLVLVRHLRDTASELEKMQLMSGVTLEPSHFRLVNSWLFESRTVESGKYSQRVRER